ncbi:uncharacterized protein ASPGLDRAFT_60098 [Aspergillus glaucus CBS 516.65]|uniref:Uncharacterized protein n=1 Tax=Aspergillus glaucus CBS 516.65 TaxID=1160497 RepID=A0A1L9VCG5_ASPGL|nr:hypothetical protein ASPGLDRAFT_60098 [Aspergillus glaucus CBS 516.65]OJJ81618.1 hypothetical protein ASPGLDRAFT_60098 [Aspergillus glaucus CBS 516.65]
MASPAFYTRRFLSNRLPLVFQAPIPRTQRLSASTTAEQATSAKPSPASNPEVDGINVSRGKESRYTDAPPSSNMQSPISARRGLPSEAQEGEEQTTTDAQIKNDPRESLEKKRENVRKTGEKPMGKEDFA